MSIEIILFLVSILIALICFFILWKKFESEIKKLSEAQKNDPASQILAQWMTETKGTLDSRLQEVRGNIDDMRKTLAEQLQSTNKTIGDRLDNAAKVFGDVQRRLGEVQKSTEQVYETAKDLRKLEEILHAPKLRGGIGEFLLGDFLSQILPPKSYTLQYSFKSGVQVDAVIHLIDKMVPVDSKFPLENFKRFIGTQNEEDKKVFRKKFMQDVRKHVDDIANKYIIPDEGTFDFALMYIPAENVYYETIIKDESFGEEKSLSVYAMDKKVIPVSPNSFFAYLQAIALGLKGLEIEKSASEIKDKLGRLRVDFRKFIEDFEILGGHLSNAMKKYEDADKKLGRFDEKLNSLEEIKTQELDSEEQKRLL